MRVPPRDHVRCVRGGTQERHRGRLHCLPDPFGPTCTDHCRGSGTRKRVTYRAGDLFARAGDDRGADRVAPAVVVDRLEFDPELGEDRRMVEVTGDLARRGGGRRGAGRGAAACAPPRPTGSAGRPSRAGRRGARTFPRRVGGGVHDDLAHDAPAGVMGLAAGDEEARQRFGEDRASGSSPRASSWRSASPMWRPSPTARASCRALRRGRRGAPTGTKSSPHLQDRAERAAAQPAAARPEIRLTPWGEDAGLFEVEDRVVDAQAVDGAGPEEVLALAIAAPVRIFGGVAAVVEVRLQLLERAARAVDVALGAGERAAGAAPEAGRAWRRCSRSTGWRPSSAACRPARSSSTCCAREFGSTSNVMLGMLPSRHPRRCSRPSCRRGSRAWSRWRTGRRRSSRPRCRRRPSRCRP